MVLQEEMNLLQKKGLQLKNFLRRLLARLPWQLGRQSSGYSKLALIISRRFLFDIYILKFPVGSYIDNHKDPVVDDFEHHRLNVILSPAIRGGKLVIKGQSQDGKVHKFRPDKFLHKVTEIKEGTRYVLSIGWLKYTKDRAA